MPLITCTRILEWDAMHRIPNHEGKCKAFHGHRYKAEITCAAPSLDEKGRVVDFSVIKQLVGTWVDSNWDHTAILMRDDPDPASRLIIDSNKNFGRPVYLIEYPPTAENIAHELARISEQFLSPLGVQVVAVKVWETPNSFATWLLDSSGYVFTETRRSET